MQDESLYARVFENPGETWKKQSQTQIFPPKSQDTSFADPYAPMHGNPNTRSADWHLSFFLEDDVSCYDKLFERAWGTRVGDSFVTAVGYYLTHVRIQTGHALIQLSRDVSRAELETYIGKRLGSYCLFSVRGHVMPQQLVNKLERSHGTFAAFSVKELYA